MCCQSNRVPASVKLVHDLEEDADPSARVNFCHGVVYLQLKCASGGFRSSVDFVYHLWLARDWIFQLRYRSDGPPANANLAIKRSWSVLDFEFLGRRV